MAETSHDVARQELEDARSQLAAQVAALDGGDDGAFDENFADSGQVAAEQGENRSLANQLRTELDEVERALAKLDDGTYGTCEVCGNPIASARLEAMPATRFCIDHA
ncbi:MAG: TraR/DksA C4-type zinc finger protein [Actinomycetota bacterium]|nr:TraR/DksA C4-type zinc finger protein [Actinomycetota bacterium]